MEKSTTHFVPVTTSEQIAQTALLADKIWRDCYAHILQPEQITYMLDNIQSIPAMTRQIQKEGYQYFLICAGEEALGYVGVQEKDRKLFLSKLYLLAAYRGKQLGRQALQFVEDLANQKGCTSIWLTVNRHNERAISVYKKAGYTLTREEATDIGDGFVMDDFIFEKSLQLAG